jgi:hypothetical protein
MAPQVFTVQHDPADVGKLAIENDERGAGIYDRCHDAKRRELFTPPPYRPSRNAGEMRRL